MPQPLNRKDLIHRLGELISARSGVPEIVSLHELVDAMVEDAKEQLVTAQSAEFLQLQGFVQGLRKLQNHITPDPRKVKTGSI